MERFPYAELINELLRTGERRIVGTEKLPDPIEISIDGKGQFIGIPFFHCDSVNNPDGFEKVVRDVMINLKINPNFLVPSESKTISLEFHEMGKRVTISIHKSSVMLTSGIEEINAITEVPHILACASLFSCIYFWKNPEMLEVTEDGMYYYAFGFKFLSPYVLISQLPLLRKMEKTDERGHSDELFTLRIASEMEDASNLKVEDFWMDPVRCWTQLNHKIWSLLYSPDFLMLDFLYIDL